ncbi:GxxExxY protein [Tangfeifania diversioriginum]|uniref:GxxExxY protein n=1 Tax=Tangfeifania diversioriginum TaxID=1168035 RepID=A0A1M6JC21_9BACT|nr:GxxExxY protein [Tangfeifania diversioriginum]SHJ44180.1 GxxExxY protein [Tangfeifania diversioriginum]
MNEDYKHTDLTGEIINRFYKVYNTLGYGFLEKVYEKALKYELEKFGLLVERQKPINVFYETELVGEYFADLLVENQVIIELKAAETICEKHKNQLVNYLKATEIEVGLLLNFGKKPEIKRKIFSNKNKEK